MIVEFDWLSAKQVQGLLQISRKTLDRWTAGNQFPKPVRCGLGRGVLRWNRTSIQKFLQEREALVQQPQA
jgi:predicted DNA-binding transcriptional regulator AlpA